jgi:hypothetical protein
MTLTVTLLMSSGDPDPTWHLTSDQTAEFGERLRSAPVQPVVTAPPSRRPGYAGLMVRSGDGERWVVWRGWVRGGMNTHTDERRVLEQWLLDTGRDVVPPPLRERLTREISPPADPNAKPPTYG